LSRNKKPTIPFFVKSHPETIVLDAIMFSRRGEINPAISPGKLKVTYVLQITDIPLKKHKRFVIKEVLRLIELITTLTVKVKINK